MLTIALGVEIAFERERLDPFAALLADPAERDERAFGPDAELLLELAPGAGLGHPRPASIRPLGIAQAPASRFAQKRPAEMAEQHLDAARRAAAPHRDAGAHLCHAARHSMREPMTRDQKVVAMGAASGVASMALAMWLLSTMVLPAPAGVETLADRLGYALRWAAFAALPLVAMIAAVGNARATSAAIDPTLGLESRAMIVDGRVADNSFQQYVLFLAGALAPRREPAAERIQIVGAAAIVFVAARLAFWIGYRIDPLYRAFGFAATFYLNLGLLLGALWLGFA